MKKKLLSLLLSISMLFSLSGIALAAPEEGNAQTTVKIVHTNDLHGYYTATSRGQIGFSALKAVIDQEQPALVLDAGDTFHGQAFATVEKGASIAQLMAAVGYDATTPGNHDWSYGKDQLKALGQGRSFKILAANVVTDSASAFFDTPYLVKDVVASDNTPLRIGVFGVIDDAFYTSTPPAHIAGLQFLPEADKANEVALILRDVENCDIVIALTHQADLPGFVSALHGVDAVIAGHEHLLINSVYLDADGREVPVVEAGYYFQNIGVLTLAFDPTSGRVDAGASTARFLSASDTAGLSDPTVDQTITSIVGLQEPLLNREIGQSTRALPYSWEELRVSEQGIGRLVTNAYRNATGADVAIENAGGIRAGLPEGQIVYKDMISISPYGNTLVVRRLTGQQLLNVLEHAIDIGIQCDAVYTLQKQAVANGEDPYQYAWPENSGSYLQFSGISATYDVTRPAGSRVIQAQIGGAPLDPARTYSVATNSYVIADAEYPDIVSAPTQYEISTCEEALIKFIQTGDFEKGLDVPGLAALVPGPVQPTPSATVTPAPTESAQTSPAPSGAASPSAAPTAQPSPAPSGVSSPDTGDDAQIYPLLALMLAALVAANIVLAIRQRTRAKEDTRR